VFGDLQLSVVVGYVSTLGNTTIRRRDAVGANGSFSSRGTAATGKRNDCCGAQD
jgi:hypothetical protein